MRAKEKNKIFQESNARRLVFERWLFPSPLWFSYLYIYMEGNLRVSKYPK